MSAKHKLNAAHFHGALLLAGALGWITESWGVFAATFAALFIAGLHSGDIRR